MKEKDPLNIVITGVGGQGNVLLSQTIGKVLVRGGFHTTIGETYGASQRGGAVMSHLRLSRQTQYGNPEVAVITNSRPVAVQAMGGDGAPYPTPEEIAGALRELSSSSRVIDATNIALEIGPPVLANIVMMGALVGTGLLPVGPESFEAELRESLPPDRLEMNLSAFRRGLAETSGTS